MIQVDFALTPNAQIWPRSLNSDIGGTADGIYLIVGDAGESINSAIVYDPTGSFIGPATNNNDGTGESTILSINTTDTNLVSTPDVNFLNGEFWLSIETEMCVNMVQ